MSENLDIKNIIEIEKIRKVLVNHPDLLSIFEMLVIISNNRINEEKLLLNMSVEPNEEPELSDHESDEED
tara:strand:- start:371 stop:580 length:210 start_codon:yes stop_codon:yes gene_type:complete